MTDTDEITALRAENQRLREWNREIALNARELVAEIERLRAALREVMDDLTLISKNHWLPVGLLDDVIYVNARAALDGQPAPSEWRPIDTAPKNGSRMLIAYQTYLGKWRRVIAFYASKLAVEQNDYESDWCEYDEANERYFLPEGWYECIENLDDYSSVHMSGIEPTHWMPLPPAPGKEEA